MSILKNRKYIKYWYLIMIIVANTITNHAHISTEITKKQTLQEITTYIYGPPGLNIPVNEYQKIEALLIAIDKATIEQKIGAISFVVESLKHKLRDTNTYIQDQYYKQQIVPLPLFFKTFMLNHQISYLKKLDEELTAQQRFIFNIINWMSNKFIKLKTWIISFFRPKEPFFTPEESLAHQIVNYIDYEHENILLEYHKQVSCFTSLKKIPLPDNINFWSSLDIQRQLYVRAQQVSERIIPQVGIGTLVDFALQGALIGVGSVAVGWINQDNANKLAKIEKQQSKIQQDWKTFVSKIKKQAKQIMDKVVGNFEKEFDGVQKEYTASSKLMRKEIQYLMRSLNIVQPKQVYLTAPLDFDIAFEGAPMATPAPHTWYNTGRTIGGDWEYDPKTNSFWQNGLKLFGVPAWKTDPKTKKAGRDVPEYNSIFIESIINGSEYEIEVECTIYTVSGSPFFAGIMFNKARWLSGDPERIRNYRLFGLYGTEKTLGDSSTRSIDAIFAQQQIIPAKGKIKEQILSPMQLIDTQATTHFATNIIGKDELKNLSIEPMIFVFNIITKPSSVTCTLSKQETDATGKRSFKQLAQKTIQGLDRYIFLYHGIGFMAPGCQASFKLTKPVELVYTQEQIKAYKTKSS